MEMGSTDYDKKCDVDSFASICTPEQMRRINKDYGNIEAVDESTGRTSLHRAVLYNINSGVVRVLLESGAKVAVKDKAGYTPLDYARARLSSDAEIIDLLEAFTRRG